MSRSPSAARDDNAETDNYRYGDPTYPRRPRRCGSSSSTRERASGELPLGDVAHERPPGRVFARREAARDPGGGALDWIGGAGDVAARLERRRRSGMRLSRSRAPTSIAPTSTLDWTPDGTPRHRSRCGRSRARRAAAERFAALTRGPIIVHSSKEPFLEWDDLNRLNRWRTVVEVDVATRRRHRRACRSARSPTTGCRRDGSLVVLQEDATEKTDYDTIGGTENRLLVWARGEAEPQDAVRRRKISRV